MIQIGDRVIHKRSGRRLVVISTDVSRCEVALIIDGRVTETYSYLYEELIPEKIDESHDLGDVSDSEIQN